MRGTAACAHTGAADIDAAPPGKRHCPLPMSEPSRIEMLQQFLAENPGDAFARYGLAMEYSKLGQVDTALAEYRKLLELNPDYTAGYQMAAQMLAAAGRSGEARKMFADGIASAQRTGNVHAKSEMEAMLAELG